jgi:hypothetical protein
MPSTGNSIVVALVAALVTTIAPGLSSVRAAEGSSGQISEVERQVRISTEGLDTSVALSRSGWVVVNRKSRRLYQVVRDATKTAVQSFDLDTLQPRRRAVFQGWVHNGGTSSVFGGGTAGEVLHAVDDVHGRIYLALQDGLVGGLAVSPKDFVASAPVTASPDGQNAVSRFVAIDEAAFDRCAGTAGCAFASSFRSPVPTDHDAWLRTMGVVPDPRGGPGRLAVVWTTPSYVLAPAAHQLTVWDTSGAQFRADATQEIVTAYTPGVVEVPGSRQVLGECAGGPMTYGAPGSNDGTYQWGVLVRPDALWLACQSKVGSGKVVSVPVTAAGAADPTRPSQSFPLSQPIGDVIVDPGAGRLLLKSTGPRGVTWWVFDTARRRFTGSVAAVLDRGVNTSTGLDPASGRLYTGFADYTVTGGGRSASVRGGLFSTDSRLDPVPALEARDPALGTTNVLRIVVDPDTRRLFYRRGTSTGLEPFFRVLRDDRPVASDPPEQDDRRFTVDTTEAPGLTKASYLGTASGYGSRVLLTGGLAAATAPGTPTDRKRAADSASACTAGDRDLALGRVESATLSDLSASGTAAALSGDPDTEEQSDAPVNRCWPERRELDADPRDPDFDRLTNPTKNGEVVDTKELDFDTDDDGASDFRTECVGDDDPDPAHRPGRDGFEADVNCDQTHQSFQAESTGQAILPGGITVGYSHSQVDIHRKPGGGLVARAEAIARDIDIEGVGRIGVVRTTAVAEAAGRGGSARADFDRSICGVDIPAAGLVQASCLGPDQQVQLAQAFNRAFSGQAEMRLRDEDPRLAKGSPSGYASAIQRDRIDLFYDKVIARDTSLAVPGLEIVFFRGDDPNEGAGRQIVQLAAVQAGTSYGIACLYGQGRDGTCSRAVDDEVLIGSDGDEGAVSFDDDGNPVFASGAERGGGAFDDLSTSAGRRESLVERIVKFPVRLAADVLRLLFSNPREFGLMAAVWALLYAPCYLGERRRAIRRVETRRLATG